MSNQFRALWPRINKEWAAWKKSNKGHHINTKNFWKQILEQYAYLATEFFELINIVVSLSPGTEPLEQSCSKLEKICKTDRNNLGARPVQNLWLLTIYQLKDDEVFFNGLRKFGPLIVKK